MIFPYRYRWLYAIILNIILLSFSYYYLIQQKWQHLDLLKKEINHHKKILSVMAEAKYLPKKMLGESNLFVHSQPEFIFDVTTSVYRQGLHLRSLHFLPNKDRVHLLVHLVLRGQYLQLLTFIDNLYESHYPLTILDFDYKLGENNYYEFSMDISMRNGQREMDTPLSLPKIVNPFCNADNGLIEQLDKINLQAIALEQLKMVGYFKQNNHVFALLRIPGNRVTDIGVGDVIGKERGVVKYIFKNKIAVQMPQGNLQSIQ